MAPAPKLTLVSTIRKVVTTTSRLDRKLRVPIIQSALLEAGLRLFVEEVSAQVLRNLIYPERVEQILREAFGNLVDWVHVTGTIEDRLVFLGQADGTGIVCSLGNSLSHVWSDPIHQPVVSLECALSEHVGKFRATLDQRNRLIFPRVLLISLFHPENFPLPRFPLGISDIARSLRKQMLGSVSMIDMQFGLTSKNVIKESLRRCPDIVGISATFGQHDILEEVLHGIRQEPDYRPLVVVGGSIAALNYESLLRTFLVDMVAMGPGERTMQDIVRYWHGSLPQEEIHDVAYFDPQTEQVMQTHRLTNRDYDDILPELDLLYKTLEHDGVMQLESSRGCSYACSFCPREHKGIWAGEDARTMDALLPEIEDIFAKFPHIDRRIFLVDEEFVGYENEELTLNRCVQFSCSLMSKDFRFETSSRIDQVYRAHKNEEWHIRRMAFWAQLCSQGLDRCLFGVESGVDSILARFNKRTSSTQNVAAIRILTSLGVPIRCTYITFDPLMSFDELEQTYRFLGRRDLILRKHSNRQHQAIYSGIHDCDYIAENVAGIPFYTLVSYMLVSLEGLIGSPYLASADRLGLVREVNPLMGRREIVYLDERIGKLSQMCQLWVDRNFSLDYLLKSIEKISNAAIRKPVREMRILMREAAYELLGLGLAVYRRDEVSHGINGATIFVKAWTHTDELSGKVINSVEDLHGLLDLAFSDLVSAVGLRFDKIREAIPERLSQAIGEQLTKWSQKTEWKLINVNEACE